MPARVRATSSKRRRAEAWPNKDGPGVADADRSGAIDAVHNLTDLLHRPGRASVRGPSRRCGARSAPRVGRAS